MSAFCCCPCFPRDCQSQFLFACLRTLLMKFGSLTCRKLQQGWSVNELESESQSIRRTVTNLDGSKLGTVRPDRADSHSVHFVCIEWLDLTHVNLSSMVSGSWWYSWRFNYGWSRDSRFALRCCVLCRARCKLSGCCQRANARAAFHSVCTCAWVFLWRRALHARDTKYADLCHSHIVD